MKLVDDFVQKTLNLIKLRKLLKENQSDLLEAQNYLNNSPVVHEAREFIKVGFNVLIDLIKQIEDLVSQSEVQKIKIMNSEQKCTWIQHTTLEHNRLYKKSKLWVQCGRNFSDWKDASEQEAQRIYQYLRIKDSKSSSQKKLLEAREEFERQQNVLNDLRQQKKIQMETIVEAQKILATAQKSIADYSMQECFLVNQISYAVEELNRLQDFNHQDILNFDEIDAISIAKVGEISELN